ncbi:unnamed protein product [Spirodela intermedia]|uniref:Uncharacterized protein n=1 Tax=Spirodela intermedia TaxID=51605 RepID=A0A7I8J7Z4_SPIIN|nr:unnamed protein product [Spirodela intermedia]CAA6665865.1 unnamed protein product [Spirodela intermedia]
MCTCRDARAAGHPRAGGVSSCAGGVTPPVAVMAAGTRKVVAAAAWFGVLMATAQAFAPTPRGGRTSRASPPARYLLDEGSRKPQPPPGNCSGLLTWCPGNLALCPMNLLLLHRIWEDL